MFTQSNLIENIIVLVNSLNGTVHRIPTDMTILKDLSRYIELKSRKTKIIDHK